MELRTIIRTDIAASAIAHLTLVALIILISEVHPFRATPPETVTVDIVTPEEVKQEEAKADENVKEEVKQKTPEPPSDLKLPKLDVTDKAPEASKPAPPQPAASPTPEPQRPAQQQPQQQPPPKPREANAQPQAQPMPPPRPQPQAAPPPAYQTPQPDVTIKYGVMLGLPPELPLPLSKDGPKDDGGGATDSIAAKLPAEVIAALRSHLRSCAKLPAELAPTDNVHIKLRTVFATDGTLAREPILLEAPPSAKGVALVKSATSALQNCQPYKMLPANLYEEWKVLDLPFSPRDLGG
ncbi:MULTISPECIES: hypothetical protein [unclassified Bradyrhizobium]|uniref:hypothetical protein n=1 Tax=unclassified Bradyrhizobium TaxID=2631580 RepID=UPI00211E6CB2|nr:MULTISPECIES: hypothetical protein [unclassified Bradyrhizobium]MDD1536301.1 hypothetical protein [Bradyrhizobium sp. WBOS8]MDD1586062.1 hypothetical protein [Bradyrhizobium sp. WBOS4]UUO48569.1 hypothetical protein DCM78_17635 [Bradyrhizobium sp. WBOS04]UUO62189.1 hypothetical protein DCM80_25380 [Bradyrhizobium sp. WBOS08]